MNVLTENLPARSEVLPGLEEVIDLREGERTEGLWIESAFSAPSAADGIFLRRRIVLPAFDRACYYAPFQKHAIDPSLDLWPEGYNQCHPLSVDDLCDAKRGGFFLVLQLTDGSYLALLPVVTSTSMAWLRGDAGGVTIEAGHWGIGSWEGDLPLLGWARGRNLYAACERVWRMVLRHPLVSDRARMREEKKYPEIFRYLGWCSWEEFKWDISEEVLVDAIRALDASPVPVNWVLVDDGHIDEGAKNAEVSVADRQEGEVPVQEGDRRLFSLEVNRTKFPRGWQPVLEAGRGSRIKWFGVWLNFNGYWGGIHPHNLLGDLNEALIETREGVLQPAPSPSSAEAFYEAFVARQHGEGFDFVKVDNQAKNITFYRGHVPNAVQATMGNHQALEGAVNRHLQAMINCMAHNNLCAFSTRHSQITRCSEDYKKGDLWRAKHHLNNSFANMLWLGQTVWGDHDMFHSSDLVARDVMARSKAISGGPIYLSDQPANIDLDLVRPLCFEDGLLLQPLAPAVPLPESVFIDTYEDDDAYRVIAPLSHGCAAVAVYNLTHPAKPVYGKLSRDDYRCAGALMQDGRIEWRLPVEGVIAYDVKNRRVIDLREGDHDLRLEDFGDEFFLLCPIVDGVAVIGREDKILAPQGVRSIERRSEAVRLELPESGPVLLWATGKELHPGGAERVVSLGHGLWRVDLPILPASASISLRF